MKPLALINRAVGKQPGSTIYNHLQKVIDSLLDVVCIIDIDGYYVQVSKACKNLWGFTPEELIGKPFMEMVVEADRERTAQATELLLAGAELINFENHYYKKDGTVVPISWSSRWDEVDQKIYCIGRDISEKKAVKSLQKQYDQKLKGQNKQIAHILERITDGFIAVDEDYRVIYWNKEAEKMLGLSREDALTRNIWEVYPEGKENIFQEQCQKAVEQQLPVHFEATFDPVHRWVEVSAYPSENGLSVFFKDITERKNSEEELHKLSRIAQQTANSVILTDAQERIVWVNEAFTKITGYSFEEAINQVPAQLLQGPETDVATARYMTEQKEKGEPFRIEALSYKKNGETYWSEITCEPIYDAHSKLQQFFSIEIDITDKKRLQEQLRREQEERRKKITAAVIKAQEDERAQVGQELHDNVNQVLTTVKLYTELCLGGIDKSQELMEKSVQLLIESINEIRALSKRLSAPSLGKIPLKESIMELVEAISATKRLVVNLAVNIGDLDVDSELHLAVYRILQEHLTNVLKHAAAKTVQVIITKDDGNLSIVVSDDGKGFDTNERRKGIGITNMISRAESLGGDLQLISTVGTGCTLIANFPIGQLVLPFKASVK